MKRLLAALVLAAGAALVSSAPAQAVDCIIFQDGTLTWAEMIELCIEFDEGYTWEIPPYEDDYPHDCFIYQYVGATWEETVEACLAGFEAEGWSGSTYQVRDGDLSLWSISQKYGIPFGALLDANPESPDLIRVGDVIRFP